MQVPVHFYSYFKDVTGCAETFEAIPEGSTLTDILKKLFQRFPKLAAMERSMLVAVGVDYQPRNYVLKNGDEVSLFPPVQGG
jgi:molybdopterin converting factor small subunit